MTAVFGPANFSGTTWITRLPRLTLMRARPTPVLPAVGSMMVAPGRRRPDASAAVLTSELFTLLPWFGRAHSPAKVLPGMSITAKSRHDPSATWERYFDKPSFYGWWLVAAG